MKRLKINRTFYVFDIQNPYIKSIHSKWYFMSIYNPTMESPMEKGPPGKFHQCNGSSIMAMAFGNATSHPVNARQIIVTYIERKCQQGGRLNIKAVCNQYRNSHYKDKTVSGLSHLYNEDPIPVKAVLLVTGRYSTSSLWSKEVTIPFSFPWSAFSSINTSGDSFTIIFKWN